jgi:hypothetical protein
MMYIVKYSGGEWGDYYQVNIFVTADKELAERYVEKFNSILKKWKDYFSQFKDEYGFSIKDEYLEHSDRYYAITKINKCYYDEIEFR